MAQVSADSLTVEDVAQEIRSLLDESITGAKDPYASGGREYVVRCAFCGDSENLDNHHMYIAMRPPFVYQCQRCNESGRLDDFNFFKQHGLFDSSVLANIKAINDEYYKENGAKLSISGSKHLFRFLQGRNKDFLYTVENPDAPVVVKKIAYISNRFGCNFTLEELYEKRIILDLKNFFRINKITKLNTDLETMIGLHENYLGFHSGTKGFITFRQAGEEKSMLRLYDYPLFGRSKTQSKYYWIPHEIDLFAPSLTLNLCEGVMDSLGLEKYLGRDTSSSVTVAVCGKNFFSPIEFFLKLGFLDLNINIYADADVATYFYKRWLWFRPILQHINAKVRVFHNTIGHDYGVKPECINLKVDRLQ